MSLALFGGLLSGVMGAMSANKAAKAQEKAAADQLALQKQIYGEQTQNFAPWLESGKNYLAALNSELLGTPAPTFGGYTPEVRTIPGRPGMATQQRPQGRYNGVMAPALQRRPTPARYGVNGQTFATLEDAQRYAQANSTPGTTYGGFQETPGFKYALDQGQSAIEASAAARGGLYSGRTMEALQGHALGLANQEYGNYLNRLIAMSAGGQAAAGNQANAGSNYATGAGTAYANRGDAQAAGAIGMGNAFQNGIMNGLALWNYQNQAPNNSGIGWSGWGMG